MKTTLNLRQPRKFFLGTFLFSWLVWGMMIIFPPKDDLFVPLLFLGAFGPSIVALYLVAREVGLRSLKEFADRILNFRRISWKWYLFIFLFFPAVLLLGYSVILLLGGESPDVNAYFGGINTTSDFLYLLIFMLLGGPLAEELGWRGYILEPLQEKWGKLRASLIIGFFWVLWHLPLFFIEGTSQSQKGFGIAFWSWTLQLFFLSIIFTWVYNFTRRSILAAILLHLMANFAYPLNLDTTGEIVFTIVRFAILIPILMAWSGKLSRQDMTAQISE